jgi:hypothetical protein
MAGNPDHPGILVMNEHFYKKLRFVICSQVPKYIDRPILVTKA